MARTKRTGDENALPEGGVIEPTGLAEIVIDPVASSGSHASKTRVVFTDLNVMTSEGRFFEGWRAYLPEDEANDLIAEGRAKLCP